MKKFIILFLCVSLLYSGCKWTDIFKPKTDKEDEILLATTTADTNESVTSTITVYTNAIVTNAIVTNESISLSFMTNNLMGEWTFATNEKDTSINSNHSVFFGDAFIVNNCRVSKGALIIQNYMTYSKATIPSDNILDFTNDFSITIWVEPNMCAEEKGYVLSRKSESNPNEGWFLYWNGTNSFSWNSTKLGGYTEYKWYFLTIVYEKNTKIQKIFVDNQLKFEEILTNTVYPTGSGCDLLIGVEYPSSTRCVDCWVSDFRLFNKALTTNEISYLYEH